MTIAKHLIVNSYRLSDFLTKPWCHFSDKHGRIEFEHFKHHKNWEFFVKIFFWFGHVIKSHHLGADLWVLISYQNISESQAHQIIFIFDIGLIYDFKNKTMVLWNGSHVFNKEVFEFWFRVVIFYKLYFIFRLIFGVGYMMNIVGFGSIMFFNLILAKFLFTYFGLIAKQRVGWFNKSEETLLFCPFFSKQATFLFLLFIWIICSKCISMGFTAK